MRAPPTRHSSSKLPVPFDTLRLPGYKVVQKEESPHGCRFTIEAAFGAQTCPSCHSDRLIGHGRKEVAIRDIPVSGEPVSLMVANRRWRCQACGTTFMATLPAVNAKHTMTERLFAWIGQQSINRTFISVAEEAGLDEKTVRNIFRHYLDELEALHRFEAPHWMAIGDVLMIKPRCVISNLQQGTVVDILVNQSQDTLENRLESMQDTSRIQYVTMGISVPYREAVRAVLPNATIMVGQRFVVQLADDAMESARSNLRMRLEAKQIRGLLHDRRVLHKRYADLSAQERASLARWVKDYPVLGEVYQLKEEIHAIYASAENRSVAQKLIAAWGNSVKPECRHYFTDLIQAFADWKPWILNYFDHQAESMPPETLIGALAELGQSGRGHSFEALRAQVLFAKDASQFNPESKL